MGVVVQNKHLEGTGLAKTALQATASHCVWWLSIFILIYWWEGFGSLCPCYCSSEEKGRWGDEDSHLNYSFQSIGFCFRTSGCEASSNSQRTLKETRECLGKLSVKQGHLSGAEKGRREYLMSQSWLVYGPQSLNLCDSNPVPYIDCIINNPSPQWSENLNERKEKEM